MSKIYASDTSRCALCGQRIATTQHVGLFQFSKDAVIGYTLCSTCGPKARQGLTPDQHRLLDNKLDAEATRLGLSKIH